MVKTPRTRHSKSAKEPVTIDLTPGEVSRVKAEAEASGETKNPNAGERAASGSTASPSGGSASVSPTNADQPPKPEPAKPAETVRPASANAGAAPSDRPKSPDDAARSAFGRQEPAKPASEPSRSGGFRSIVAGVAGGIVALVLALGLQFGGLLPSPSADSAPGPSVEALQAEIAALREEIATVGPAAVDPALGDRIAQAEERIASLSSALESLRGDVERSTGAPAPDLAPLEERIAALETAIAGLGGSATPEAALAAVDEQITTLRDEIAAAREAQNSASGRLDSVEQALADLTTRFDEQAEAPGTALVIAASALKAAIDRGTPFMTELETYASLAPDAPQLAQLRDLAAGGVPTRAQIAAAADAAATAMIDAARPVDPEAGVLDRLWASAQGLVEVRPIGMVEGDDVPAIVARLEAAVAGNDYARAVAEFETLPDAARSAGQAFMETIRARHAADGLVDEALAAALRS